MTDAAKLSPPSLSMDRRKFALGAVLAGASAFAATRIPVANRPKVPAKTLEALIPKSVGPWQFVTTSGLVLPPPDALSDRIYDNLVTRIYASPDGVPMMLLIAYNNSQDGVLQIHRPEICYPAGGYTLSETGNVDVPLAPGATLPCQAFAASSNVRDESVLYWSRVGTEFPRKWREQRYAVASANLRGIIPDGLLVRVSTLGGDLAATLPVMEHFIQLLATASPPQLRQLFFDRLLEQR